MTTQNSLQWNLNKQGDPLSITLFSVVVDVILSDFT
jgi:hypothetical protein